MYDYRRMSPAERQAVLQARKADGFPLHAPPHLQGVSGEYLITAACYEHRPIFEHPDDLAWFVEQVMVALNSAGLTRDAWVFLPSHYHVLLQAEEIKRVSEVLRLLHSRVATAINGRHRQRGRQVWHRYTDRGIRGERHHWATVNYIHLNPVKHGYVDHPEDWPWSSLRQYLDTQGAEWVTHTLREYPVGDYGKGWDW